MEKVFWAGVQDKVKSPKFNKTVILAHFPFLVEQWNKIMVSNRNKKLFFTLPYHYNHSRQLVIDESNLSTDCQKPKLVQNSKCT